MNGGASGKEDGTDGDVGEENIVMMMMTMRVMMTMPMIVHVVMMMTMVMLTMLPPLARATRSRVRHDLYYSIISPLAGFFVRRAEVRGGR